MTARSPSALFLSAGLHAAIVVLALLFTYAVRSHVEDPPKVFELVAGQGDNYEALEAPALGIEGGIKVPLQELPAPTPLAPVPISPPQKAEPEPVLTKAPAENPVTKAPPKPTETKTPNFSQQIKRKIIRSESKAKQEVKKEREAEQKRLTKEEFDRQNKAAKVASARGNPKVTKIDAEGIAGGVVGGSTANKKGGANGKALSREEADLMDAYFSYLKRQLTEALDKPPGLSDSLKAVAEFRLAADGSISGARISRSSGSEDFDRAVLDAISRYRPTRARPDKKSEIISVNFLMKEEE